MLSSMQLRKEDLVKQGLWELRLSHWTSFQQSVDIHCETLCGNYRTTTTYSSKWHQVQYGFVHDANKPEKAVLLDASWVSLHALHGNVNVHFSNSMVLVIPGLSWHSLPAFRFGAYCKSNSRSKETASTNFWSKSANIVVLRLKQHQEHHG